MNLKELKELVKEEYEKFMYEADDEKDTNDDAPKSDDKPKADDKPKKAKAPKVDVGGGDIDMKGDENPEKTLRDIYDMLKDFFEGDKEDKADDKADDKPEMPKAPEMPKGDDMLSAGHGMGHSMMEGKKEESKALVERFKKLANIIK